MRNHISTLLTLSGLALGLAITPSLAQVAPPPTEPTKEPAQAEPAPQQKNEPASQKRPTPKSQGVKVGQLPTHIPYPKLIIKDDNGKIVRLKELPDILALRSNPTVGSKSVEAIMPVLFGRRARFEILTINNLDLYWALTSGIIDNMSMNDLAGMTKIADMVKPLVGKTTLSQELTNRGILTRVQGGMNTHIVSEYKKAVGDEIQVTGGDNSLDQFMQFILYDSFHESRLAYQALLAELIPQVDAVVAKAGVGSPAVNGILAAKADITGSPIQIESQINAFDKRFRQLSVDEAIAILSTMRQMRENPNISPFIKTIDVMHDRKSIMENSKLEVRVDSAEDIAEREKKIREKRKAEEARLEKERLEREAAKKAAEETEESQDD